MPSTYSILLLLILKVLLSSCFFQVQAFRYWILSYEIKILTLLFLYYSISYAFLFLVVGVYKENIEIPNIVLKYIISYIIHLHYCNTSKYVK